MYEEVNRETGTDFNGHRSVTEIVITYHTDLPLDQATEMLYAAYADAEEELLNQYKVRQEAAKASEKPVGGTKTLSLDGLLGEIFGVAESVVGSIFDNVIRGFDSNGDCPMCPEFNTVSLLGLCSECGEWM